MQGERGTRFRQGQAGKGRAESGDGKTSVDRRVFPRTAPVEAQIRFAPECCLLAEQFDQRAEVEIVRTNEGVNIALATDRLFPRLTGQDRFERERQEQFAAHQARTSAKKLNVLHRESLFPEIKRRGKRERSAIKKKPGNVNIAGRVAAGELAIDRHRVEVASEANQFEGGDPGMRRCRAIAIPEKQHTALARPVRSEASDRPEIPRHLTDPQLETPVVGQRIIQRELAGATQKIGSALCVKISQFKIAPLQLQIRLQ